MDDTHTSNHPAHTMHGRCCYVGKAQTSTESSKKLEKEKQLDIFSEKTARSEFNLGQVRYRDEIILFIRQISPY